MKKINVKLKKLRDGAKIPQYATEQAAACDLCADLEGGKVNINPGEIKTIPTGIAIECEEATEYNTAILIFPRSGLASKHGISLANSVGVVDSDYRGEIIVPLINHSTVPFEVSSGDRIAQMMFTPVLRAGFEESDELSDTERGMSGFGSTGIQ